MPEMKTKPSDKIGLVCHKCGGDRWRVIYTRGKPGGKLMRRRECRACSTRITTRETRL